MAITMLGQVTTPPRLNLATVFRVLALASLAVPLVRVRGALFERVSSQHQDHASTCPHGQVLPLSSHFLFPTPKAERTVPGRG